MCTSPIVRKTANTKPEKTLSMNDIKSFNF